MTKLTVVETTEVTFDEMKAYADSQAKKLGCSWVDVKVRKLMAKKFPELKVPASERTDAVADYIRADSAGRAWISRKKLFGPSGYKAGHAPWTNRKSTRKKVSKPGPFDV